MLTSAVCRARREEKQIISRRIPAYNPCGDLNGLTFADFAFEDIDAERPRISLVNYNAFLARRGQDAVCPHLLRGLPKRQGNLKVFDFFTNFAKLLPLLLHGSTDCAFESLSHVCYSHRGCYRPE